MTDDGRAARLWRKFARDPVAIAALALVAAVLLIAASAPVLAPHDPNHVQLSKRLRPPAWSEGGSPEHPLGTDEVGRDVLSRVIYGSRAALMVGISSVLLSVVVGNALGLVAGYFRGRVDALITILIDVMMAFPFILLALAVYAVLGSGIGKLIAVLGLTGWTDYARVVRAEALYLRERDFVLAAQAAGGGSLRVLWRHLLPNTLPTIIVLSTLSLARVILLESSLSFLGLGIPPTIPGWGYMLAQSLQYVTRAWWLGTWPGLAILMTVLGINVVGDRVRDVLDPKVD